MMSLVVLLVFEIEKLFNSLFGKKEETRTLAWI